MELTENKELIIKIVCVLILIGLNYAIYFNGKDLTCDKCIIKFSSSQNIQSNYNIENKFNVSINDLFNNYTNKNCLVIWTEKQGFIKR